MGQFFAIFVAVTAAMGGLLFGYEIGVVNQVLHMAPFKAFFNFTPENTASLESWIVSLFIFGCIVGSLLMTVVADPLGRKRTITLASLVFAVASTMQALAPGLGLLLAGRAVGGVAVGMLSSTVPLYIAEVSSTESRGRITSVYQLMVTIGIALANVVNAILISQMDHASNMMWRLALLLQGVPGAYLFCAMFLLPDSPRWLAARGRTGEALDVLSRLRNAPTVAPEITEELEEMQRSLTAESESSKTSWAALFAPAIIKQTIVGIILQMFQQWTGINAAMYYSSSLFRGMGLSEKQATTIATTVQSIVNVVGTIPALWLIERAGRKFLLFWGAVGISLSMWGLTTFITLFNKTGETNRSLSIMGMLCMFVFVFIFACTWGPVAWVYQSEIFPQAVRSKGVGLATFSNWVNNLILSFSWPHARDAMGSYQYTVFGGASLLAAIFVATQVPETKGVPMEEMENLFAGRPVETKRRDSFSKS